MSCLTVSTEGSVWNAMISAMRRVNSSVFHVVASMAGHEIHFNT